MNKIAIGQYLPTNSIIHRLDPRTKILLTITQMIFVFLINNYLNLLLVTIQILSIIIISKIDLKFYFKSLKIIIFMAAFTCLLNLFYGSGEVIFSFLFLKIREDSLRNSIFIAFRIIFLMLISSCLTFTTLPNDLSDAIEKLMKPLSFLKVPVHEIAMMMTITIRFVPTLLEESDKIIIAQKARGARFDNKNLKKKIKTFAPVLVILLFSSLRRAYELALAMDSRCYRGGVNRTRLKTLKFQNIDFLAALFFLGFGSLILLLNISLKIV